MFPFEVIRGGLAFEDPDEIPAPDKPIEEWTPEEHEAYFLACWERAEPPTVEHAVKTIEAPADAIASALDVLEAIKTACAAAADQTGLRNEFDHESLPNLLYSLRQRVKEDAAGMSIAE